MKYPTQALTIRISLPEYLTIKEVAEDNGVSMRVIIQKMIKDTFPAKVEKHRKELEPSIKKEAKALKERSSSILKAFRD